MTAPARDEEQKRLDERFKELEQEQRKFTEAAVQQMLAELPPTTTVAGPSSLPTKVSTISPDVVPKLSTRRSPRKHRVKGALKVPLHGRVGSRGDLPGWVQLYYRPERVRRFLSSEPPPPVVPKTPRPFPMAKPFAQRMVHAIRR